MIKSIKVLECGGNMYVIIVYDVNVSRVSKINKFLKQYLHWRQNSVFEGEISISQLEKIKLNLKNILKEDDKIIIYTLKTKKFLRIIEIGKSEEITTVI